MLLVLTAVAVIMGGVLAYVNHLTEGPINEQKAKALADGIKTVMCVSDLKVAKTDTVRQNDAKGKEMLFIIYQTQDAQGKDLGAAVQSTTGGFGGDLKVLVGFDPEGKILGYTLLEHAETPGLGAKADKWTHGFPCRAFTAVSAAFTHKKAAALTLYVQYSSLFCQSVFKYVFIWDTGDGEGETSRTQERTVPSSVPRRVC